jgi:hypothetical protein
MTLYLCEYTWDGQHWQGKLAATSCPTAGANIVAGLVDVRFDTTLTGDIDGTSYGVNIALATMPNGASPSVDVRIILNRGGHETILASTAFIVTNYSGENPPFNYQFYTASVAGLDPDSSVGDRLILSIMNNGPGTMVLGHGFFQSKIVIPQVR